MNNAQNDLFAYMDGKRYIIGMAVMSLIFFFIILPLLISFGVDLIYISIIGFLFFIVSDRIVECLAEKMKDNVKKA